MFTKFGRRMDEHSENSKEIENIRKYQTELKNILEGFNSKLDEGEE